MNKLSRWLWKKMKQHKMNQSDVARHLFGTKKDGSGYTVARNRDYIGHYLAGRQPSGPILAKLAELFDADVLELFHLAAPEIRKPRRMR